LAKKAASSNFSGAPLNAGPEQIDENEVEDGNSRSKTNSIRREMVFIEMLREWRNA
jgi:hypothetical protein